MTNAPLRRRTSFALALALLMTLLIGRVPASAATPKATAVSGWTVSKATVSLGSVWKTSLVVSGPVGRRVILQQKVGTVWKSLVVARTSATHRAAFARTLAHPGSYTFRVVVPAVPGWAAKTTSAKVVWVPKNRVTAPTDS